MLDITLCELRVFPQNLRYINWDTLKWGSDHMLPAEFVFRTFQNKAINEGKKKKKSAN